MKQIFEVASVVFLVAALVMVAVTLGMLFAAFFDKLTPGDPKTDRIFYSAMGIGMASAVLFLAFALGATAA